MTEPTKAAKNVRVGLTGGIASGKSTVGKLMTNLGCFVTDADRLVAELYQPGAEGAEIVAEIFGQEYLDSSGAVDKEKLSRLVFSDSKARKMLERVVHPLVSKRFAHLSREFEGVVVFEATLLVESGGQRAFEKLVTVEADPNLRLQRAVRRGLSEPEAVARMKAQASEEERVAAADFVIRNEGTLEELRHSTGAVVEALLGQLETWPAET